LAVFTQPFVISHSVVTTTNMLQRVLNAVDRVVTDAPKLETEVGVGLFTLNSVSLRRNSQSAECRLGVKTI